VETVGFFKEGVFKASHLWLLHLCVASPSEGFKPSVDKGVKTPSVRHEVSLRVPPPSEAREYCTSCKLPAPTLKRTRGFYSLAAPFGRCVPPSLTGGVKREAPLLRWEERWSNQRFCSLHSLHPPFGSLLALLAPSRRAEGNLPSVAPHQR
jgi:hypothetical protein